MIIRGDCLEQMKLLADSSVDSVVTDPPYFLTNGGGSGFMGKPWDSLSPSNAIVDAHFRSMRLELNSDVENPVAEHVSTTKQDLKANQTKLVPFAQSDSTGVQVKSNQNTLFVRPNAITKDEALVLCKGLSSSHTRLLEKLPSNACFVIQPLFTGHPAKNIAQIIADILLSEPVWLEQITCFTNTVKTENGKSSSEAMNGTSPENKSINATIGHVENVEPNALDLISSVTTLCPIAYQQITLKITSLPFVKAVTNQCTKNQNFIPFLSEVFHNRWAREAFRVLKPGGHMLVFCGPRTYHRMASGVEDAGFEIRDQLQWLFGSGFPKSHDISKAIDKAAGAEREVVGQMGKCGMKTAASGYQDNEKWSGKILGDPATPDAIKWQGWGTALKPANEPIVLARKPLEKGLTIAENVLKYGTGGLNIDASRVEAKPRKTGTVSHGNNASGTGSSLVGSSLSRQQEYDLKDQGRFPANIILDEVAAEMLDEQSGHLHGSGNKKKGTAVKETSMFGIGENGYGQSTDYGAQGGGASRFFYCAKASKSERGEGNVHPTVKPIKLMEYLIKLITPTNGIVLDPFMGSGTTGVAAKRLGFEFIGIEMNDEYAVIAEKRIEHA